MLQTLQNIAGQVETQGFALLREYFPLIPNANAVVGLGTIAQLPSVTDAQILRPHQESESSPNTYSGNYGLGRFPLHTDLAHWWMPPRYFVLRCIKGEERVSTLLVDCIPLLDVIGETVLRRGLVQPRRPIAQERPLLRLLDRGPGAETLFRWDQLFIRPVTPAGAVAYAAVRDYLEEAEPIHIILTSPGDTLIIDNWRMLHGRSAVPIEAVARHIERTYLKTLGLPT